MKTIRELYQELKVEETVTSYGQRMRAQGRWARLKIKKQAKDLQHDVEALKKFYESQKREIFKLSKNLKRNKDKFIEKSKIFSAVRSQSVVRNRREKIVRDSEVA